MKNLKVRLKILVTFFIIVILLLAFVVFILTSVVSFTDDGIVVDMGMGFLVFIIVYVVVWATVSITLAYYVSGLICKPLAALSAFMSRAGSTGDLTMSAEDIRAIGEYSQIRDEIGRLVKNSSTFINHVVDIAKALEVIASGDLTHDIQMLSDKDTMGLMLHHMNENLNNVFGEINSSTGQVAGGAKQLADGAQSLAQGSTQQAASVEQLSASISEIAKKTKENASMAGRAAELASTILSNAEKGSRQMNDMMAAVNDINTASQSISKVIKVIDDIAFQTNILALNAAVEAARAGQHGKGFAVVAEEVRNLASKSADAAKETGNLIANSSEKAELGSRIAGETAASLEEIVSGISESNRIISQIARASEEQSDGITQINTGINHVAQVTQQNSATAEESAAASEEMSEQSAILENMVGRFKLRDGGRQISGTMTRTALPAANHSPGEAAYLAKVENLGKY